jgi:Tfp pilus assembly ATPase PilU
MGLNSLPRSTTLAPAQSTDERPLNHSHGYSQTFDQSLYDLYTAGLVTYEESLLNASNPDDFKLRVQGIRSAADTAREEMQQAIDTFETQAPRRQF